ncbi:MAG: [FeFe] hydrogenase H-cluster radical SAM maturase HydE, partial [Firmicutes bacterium]|nr:[FeFe] hydrogenase H-cluster radical SAM maturase HydE [Candidatus Fermentithermobacillaceae bacterium]
MQDYGREVLKKAIDDLLQPVEYGDLTEEFALLREGHEARVEHLGAEVHLRGIIEFSNYCRQDCLYCG